MDRTQPVHLNIGFVLFCAAVTGIGGFLFGYDTAVINGVNTFLQQHFQLDPAKDSLLIGLATAAAIIGCIPGAMSAGFISDRFGRRRILFLCAFLYAVSGVLSAIPQNFLQFVIARMLSGVAIGVSSMICPVYIAEIAPPAWRGRLGTLFQLGIVAGIFVTLLINGEIQSLGDLNWNVRMGWRWMLAAEAIPAFLFVALLVPIPESPKWLIQAGREEEARKTLHRIGGADYAEDEIAAVSEVLQQETGSFAELFSRDYRLPLTIAVFIMLASQFSGINAVIYVFDRHLSGRHGRRQRRLHLLRLDRPNQSPGHLRRHAVRRQGGTQAIAVVGQRRPGRRAAHGGLPVFRQSAIAQAAVVCHPLHGRVCDGHGADPMDLVLRNLPCQAPREGHVGLHAGHLDGLLPRCSNIPLSARVHRFPKHLLALCRLFRSHLRVCLDGDPGDQGPVPGTDRKVMA